MKKLFFILTVVCFVNQATGQSKIDSLYSIFKNEINQVNAERIKYFDSTEAMIQQLLLARDTQLTELRNESALLKGIIEQLTQRLDRETLSNKRIKSLLSDYDIEFAVITENSSLLRDSVYSSLDTLANNLNETRFKVEDIQILTEENDTYTDKRLFIVFTAIILVIMTLLLVFWYSSNGNKNVRSELNTAKSDLEAQLNNTNILFVEKLEKSLQQLISTPEIVDTEKTSFDNRELIFDFAQQIANMENNIWTLPPDDRVRKRIERAVKKMRDTFMSLGYEMPKLLGTEVTQNQMIEIKSRNEDSELMPGQIIIIRVLKPLILFNGKMEQRPVVDVKENSEE